MDGDFSAVNISYENYLGQFSGGSLTIIGQVGICLNGVVGSVCDINWDQSDASVFCNTNFGLDGNYGELIVTQTESHSENCYYVCTYFVLALSSATAFELKRSLCT